MNKLKEILLDPFYGTIIKWVFLALVGISVFLAIYFTSNRSVVSACNACFVPAVCYLVFCVFSLINNYGGFDFFQYGAIAATSGLRRNTDRKYQDAVEYREKKKQERQFKRLVFLPYLIYGILFLIPSIVLYCLL